MASDARLAALPDNAAYRMMLYRRRTTPIWKRPALIHWLRLDDLAELSRAAFPPEDLVHTAWGMQLARFENRRATAAIALRALAGTAMTSLVAAPSSPFSLADLPDVAGLDRVVVPLFFLLWIACFLFQRAGTLLAFASESPVIHAAVGCEALYAAIASAPGPAIERPLPPAESTVPASFLLSFVLAGIFACSGIVVMFPWQWAAIPLVIGLGYGKIQAKEWRDGEAAMAEATESAGRLLDRAGEWKWGRD